ncbi:MAG: hypothetical protein Q7T29_02200 [Gallionella sp.]|nr:hypothetical protein [Gallionella sp.]
MNNFTWEITGRTSAGFSPGNWPAEDWRDQLVVRLGYRPRRIGILAELALYGALDCLDIAQESELPRDVLLRVCSMSGPVSAISQVLEQNREGLPLPFSFLQSQTSQILPALAAALNWQGDACVVMARNSMNLALLACQQAGRCGMLLGWVEEKPCQSYWIRLAPCTSPPVSFIAASSFEEMSSPGTQYWRLGDAGMEIAPSGDRL